MGLFDFLGKKKQDGAPRAGATPKDLSRLARLAGEKLAQDYDRQEAIGELSKLGTPEAAEALLRRFSFNMEPTITDQDEKESALEGIVKVGEAALAPVRKFAARAESLTWPLKVLRRIVPQDRLGDELLDLLEQFDTEYTRNAEPKIQLIAALEEFPGDDVREAVEPFLTDVNETVRFHAVSTTVKLGDPRSVAALVAAMGKEESLRIRNRIAQSLSELAWEIPGELTEAARSALPPGYSLDGARVRPRPGAGG